MQAISKLGRPLWLLFSSGAPSGLLLPLKTRVRGMLMETILLVLQYQRSRVPGRLWCLEGSTRAVKEQQMADPCQVAGWICELCPPPSESKIWAWGWRDIRLCWGSVGRFLSSADWWYYWGPFSMTSPLVWPNGEESYFLILMSVQSITTS